MTNYFGFHSTSNDKSMGNLDLTASEIVASIVPVAIGMAAVGVLALLMLL